MSSVYPAASVHGEIQQIFENIFFVPGSIIMAPGFQISRNMIIVRAGKELTLISSVRLNEDGLRALDKLGEVKHVVKLGGYHLGNHNGIDDAFYVNRYQAKLWAMAGMEHSGNLETSYLLKEDGALPFNGASFFSYHTSSMAEGLILIEQEGGILISADSLQNWQQGDPLFSEAAATRMQSLGFMRNANVGPEWRRMCEPKAEDFVRVKNLNFQHLLPSHGNPILNSAKQQFSATFKELFNI